MASWSLAGSLVQLRREVDDAFPGRSTASDGTLGDAAHAARQSDHNPDERRVVRAWDCTRDVVGGLDVAETLAEWLRSRRDRRVKYVIFRRRIFSSEISPWVWRPYDGVNPHEHHVHISVQPYPVGDDGRPWGFTVEKEVLDVALTADEIERIAQRTAELVWKRQFDTGWQRDGTYDGANRQPCDVLTALSGARGAALAAARQTGAVLPT